MITEGVRLTMNDERKVMVLQRVLDGRLGIEDAARLLKCRPRSIYRMIARLRDIGPRMAVHGNRGKPSPRKMPDAVRERILGLAKGELAGVNDTHLVELLREREHIFIGRETLRSMLRNESIQPKKKRRSGGTHRDRRERKPSFGEMLQIDASPHDWLEGRGPRLTLIGAIDDATNRVWLTFREAETTEGYMSLMRGILLRYGCPLRLYSDRHMIFTSPREATIGSSWSRRQPTAPRSGPCLKISISMLFSRSGNKGQ